MLRPSPFRAFGPALLALAVVAALAGCGSSARPTPPPGTPSTRADGAAPAPSKGRADRADGASTPTRVLVPSLGISSGLMPLGLNRDGTVEVPPADRGMTAGWYTGRPVPGAPGPAVIIGHNTTRRGPAVFERLKDIREGARITVRTTAGKDVHFRVTARETVRKRSFPTEKVYGDTPERALRLITCDGAYDDAGHPVDNLIVYAVRG
ncbi:class F sortase [Streptomyces sp. NPDC002454]